MESEHTGTGEGLGALVEAFEWAIDGARNTRETSLERKSLITFALRDGPALLAGIRAQESRIEELLEVNEQLRNDRRERIEYVNEVAAKSKAQESRIRELEQENAEVYHLAEDCHDTIQEADERIEQLEATLRFYASRDNYTVHSHDGVVAGVKVVVQKVPVLQDEGDKAREALNTQPQAGAEGQEVEWQPEHGHFETTSHEGHPMRVHGDPQMSEETLDAIRSVADAAYKQFSGEGQEQAREGGQGDAE